MRQTHARSTRPSTHRDEADSIGEHAQGAAGRAARSSAAAPFLPALLYAYSAVGYYAQLMCTLSPFRSHYDQTGRMGEPGQTTIEAFWPRHQDPSSSRYERLGKIGEGAFGEVAAGLDRLTGRVVAIKSVRLGNDFEKGAYACLFLSSLLISCCPSVRLSQLDP